jgi:hypothetical protein
MSGKCRTRLAAYLSPNMPATKSTTTITPTI